jgi:hypothetical protein
MLLQVVFVRLLKLREVLALVFCAKTALMLLNLVYKIKGVICISSRLAVLIKSNITIYFAEYYTGNLRNCL